MDRRTFLGGAITASAAFCEQKAESTKAELKQHQYVIVELMGHKRLCGRLSQGISGLLQLDVPAAGGFVTQFINPAAIYRITITDENAVKQYAQYVEPLPALVLDTDYERTSY